MGHVHYGSGINVTAVFTVSEKTVCPMPYVDVAGKYCFSVTLRKQNFANSIALCEEQGGRLATIDTEEKNCSFVEYVAGKLYSSRN